MEPIQPEKGTVVIHARISENLDRRMEKVCQIVGVKQSLLIRWGLIAVIEKAERDGGLFITKNTKNIRKGLLHERTR